MNGVGKGPLVTFIGTKARVQESSQRRGCVQDPAENNFNARGANAVKRFYVCYVMNCVGFILCHFKCC